MKKKETNTFTGLHYVGFRILCIPTQFLQTYIGTSVTENYKLSVPRKQDENIEIWTNLAKVPLKQALLDQALSPVIIKQI